MQNSRLKGVVAQSHQARL